MPSIVRRPDGLLEVRIGNANLVLTDADLVAIHNAWLKLLPQTAPTAEDP